MKWPFRTRGPRIATKITVTPPDPAADRAPFAIVLIARNESARIFDWLAFHALAGVSDVLLYDNGPTDKTVEQALAFKGCRIKVVPWTLTASDAKTGIKLHQQSMAYAHAICTFGGQFRRMAFIDVDEYLVPRDAKTLQEALLNLPHPNISLPWTMFGHGGHNVTPPEAAPFAYLERAPFGEERLLNFKCIVDPSEVTCVHPHRFDTRSHGSITSNTLNMLCPAKARTGDFVRHDVIQLNHYYLGSKQDMEAKINGPDVAGTAHEERKAAILRGAALIEAQPVADDSAVAFLARHGIHDTESLRARFA